MGVPCLEFRLPLFCLHLTGAAWQFGRPAWPVGKAEMQKLPVTLMIPERRSSHGTISEGS